MNLLTLQAVKPVLARALKRCSTDAIIVDMANESQERLLNRPSNPVGSMMRYRFRATENCVVLPRQIRTIIKGAWCQIPAKNLPVWYEFDLNGPGVLNTDSAPGPSFVDHLTDCKFDDLTAGAVNRKLRITTDQVEAAGLYTWLYGYDENNQWIRTQVGGVWVDGERIDLGSAPITSTNFFTSLVRVHKDATVSITRIYEWNATTAAVVKQLGQYEPSETDPIYRRVMLPGADCYGACCNEEDCTGISVTLLVKLRHIPVAVDLDAMVIGNMAALKLMAMAIQAEEEQRYNDAMNLQQMAALEIDGELAAFIGDGQQVGLSFPNGYVFGAGNVENVIN